MSEPRPAGRLALDCLMVAVLTVVALTQLEQTYSDRSYLVAGCFALAVAMLLAVFVSESGRSVVLFIVLAVGAYVLLGPVIALRSYQDTFLPTPSDFLDVVVGPFSGWNDLLTIIPPVEPTGRELVVPYALCFAAGATSTWLALRTNLVALPVVPIVAVLSAGILLGVQQPDLLEVRAAVLVVGIVAWLTVRGRRVQDGRESDRAGGVLVTTVVVGVVCAGVVTWLAPTTPPQARVVLHGRVGQGADLSNLDNPLSSFRIFTRQQAGDNNVYDERLLRVGGLPAGQRLRFVALDTYDGSTMEPDNRTVPETVDDLFQRISHEIDSPAKGSTAAVGVRVLAPYRSSWVPTTGALTGFQFVDLDRSPQREDLRYNPATRTLVALKGLRSGDDYTFTSTLTPTEVTRAMAPYQVDGQLQREAAFLDPYIKPWATSAMTPMQKVYSLARYLRKNGRYSDGAKASEAAVYTPGHGQARLGAGFIGARVMVGDDEQYAAFMALAASRLGVPARVVVGAVPTRAGFVYGRNVLVWVELRVADGSWRTFPTAKFMSHVAPKDSEPAKQPPGAFVQGEAEAPVLPPNDPVTETRDHPASDGGHGLPDPRWLGALLTLLALATPVAKQVRRLRRRRRPVPAARIAGGWSEVVDLAGDLGRPPPTGMSRVRQARELGHGVALAELADERMFAPDAPDDVAADEFWSALRIEEKELRGSAPWPRRLWAVWNPASLLDAFRTVRLPWRRR